MTEHIIYFFYLILFLFSTIGYGHLFSKIFYKDFNKLNIGYQGLFGFFFLSIISIFSSFFISHNFYFNSVLHAIGLLGFYVLIFKFKRSDELKKLSLLFLILLLGAYVFKNHDDFPYYHLTYSLYLTENNFIVGTGNFSHGFRTFSSLFYYHSILFMPKINYFLFHIGPFYILLFVNYIFLSEIILNQKKINVNLVYFFTLLALIFINVAFYRIGEHGTDRSAQIILLLIFVIFIQLIYFQNFNENNDSKILLLLVLIFFASSMKVIYYLYLILIPLILFKNNFLKKNFLKNNFFIISFLSLSIFLNLSINYLNTGCFLYPAVKTCLFTQEWSLPLKEVERMALHYEWWSKAGGGPGYSSEVPPEIYVQNFNWLNDWIDRHFFNKVSDTLTGIIFICLISYFSFIYFVRIKKKSFKIKNYSIIYIISFLFLLEWFLNHPSMRYGGYVLLAIPFFIITSTFLESFNFDKRKLRNTTLTLIIISLVIFNFRNIQRIEKESKVYGFNFFSSPYFFVEKVNSEIILEKDDFIIYSTMDNKMCWASKTPCSNNKNLKLEKFLWMNMIYADDK